MSSIVSASSKSCSPCSRAVLIVDDHDLFAGSLGSSFAQAGFEAWHERDFSAASTVVSELRPELVVTEIRIGGEWIFDVAHALRRCGSRIAITTAYPSIATAIRAVREGFDGYVAKPATAALILGALAVDDRGDANNAEPSWPSLDLTIWEHINQVFVEAGSMSEAARRLRLDRRSLRRMLTKRPPPR
jgi:two-component system response regulator RegA